MRKTENEEVFNMTDYKVLIETEKTVFRSTVKTLQERGLFSLADVPVIASYARNVVLARSAAKDIQKLGTVIQFKDRGFVKYKSNPAVAVLHQAQTSYEATAIRLGLTPTGRKRLKSEEIRKEKTALEMFEEESDA